MERQQIALNKRFNIMGAKKRASAKPCGIKDSQ